MTSTWINCPLFKQYAKTKRAYMKEMMLENWKHEQRMELWNAIKVTFADIDDPKKGYWMHRLYSYYCHRFYWMTQCGWLIFLGELNDTAAYGEYKTDKAKRYCCLVRDTAYWMTHKQEEPDAMICEPIFFEYFDMAA